MRAAPSIHRDADGSFVSFHPRRGICVGGPLGVAFARRAKAEGMTPKEYLFRLLDLWIIVRDADANLQFIPRHPS